ncbi:kinase-like domain-containing protein [Fomitopsis serialis]|uniref:kinase-like domain-containing protein n=1 Tax=Fomitopsis serialis TaxID=139415 RepID=UPI002007D9FF|nr:kinase-like domain-containing protein [Neoantrodia serialis]KAH9919842.1 kinase-like domain-containing protein [Neoantrodia serialis]
MLSGGLAYLTSTRGEEWETYLRKFSGFNPLTCCGTTLEGHNVVVRIVRIGNEGAQHLEILRKLARGSTGLLTENHIAPLWQEVYFQDLTFVVTPWIGHSLFECYGFWAKNSVGDLVDIVLQTFQALCFIHDNNIAHRDAHRNNYRVQWFPESLTTKRVPICRPRVFLTDFEMAVEFSTDVPPEQCLLTGLPGRDYKRPVPPEVVSGQPYDPFKVDVWQLAESFSDFRSTIPEFDETLAHIVRTDSSMRPTVIEARDRLAGILQSIPPIELLIPPVILKKN